MSLTKENERNMISQTDRQTEQTGFPSVNKPWLKYYSEEAIQEKLPECTMYDLIYQENQSNLSHTALNYFGKKISYKLFFEKVNEFAKAFQACGIKKRMLLRLCHFILRRQFTVYML